MVEMHVSIAYDLQMFIILPSPVVVTIVINRRTKAPMVIFWPSPAKGHLVPMIPSKRPLTLMCMLALTVYQ